MDELLAALGKRKDKKQKPRLIENLYKVPKKDKRAEMPKFQVTKPNRVHQADLLTMPNDNGYKYVLVVIDVASRLLEAEPLKNKDATTVKNAMVKIYAKKTLKKPKMMNVDDGGEFKGATKKWFDDNQIGVRVAEVGRHRQQAFVENANRTIGKILHQRMTEEEAVTGQTSTEWKDDLKPLINAMNNRAKKKYGKLMQSKKIVAGPIRCEKNSCHMLDIGTKVRVALEQPTDNIHGNRLFGKFRASDVRWDVTVRTIEDHYLAPDQPPMYKISGKRPRYTRNQLQVVEGEVEPDASKILKGKKPKSHVVEKILDIRKLPAGWFALIKWYGWKKEDNSWERLEDIKEDVPDMVKEFKENQKKK